MQNSPELIQDNDLDRVLGGAQVAQNDLDVGRMIIEIGMAATGDSRDSYANLEVSHLRKSGGER